MFKLTAEQELLALKIHENSFVFDSHCDTILSVIDGERKLGAKSDNGHVDIPKLKAGGVNAQVFAVFVRPEWYYDAVHATMKGISILKREIENNDNDIFLARSYADIRKAVSENKIAALLSIEGGEALQGDIEMLRIYKELGVNSLILTWNNRNEIADGAEDLRSGGGLSNFGVEVITEMERLGMLVDLSHISPCAFWDVIKIIKTPFIVSHTLPRHFMDIPRNLDDPQIKAVAENGGVIGVSFYFHSYGGTQASVERVLDAIDYITALVGPDFVGIGSDFDGYDGTVAGLEDCEKLINITRGLVFRGYSDDDVEKILGANFLRVYKEVIG